MNRDRQVAWASWLEAWGQALRGAGKAPGTVRLRLYEVERFAEHVHAHPGEVTPDDVAAWFAAHEWARDTRRVVFYSLRSFYRWAVGTRRLSAEDDPTVALGTMSPSAPRPRPLPEVLYGQSLARASDDVRLMMRLAGDHGLRRAEVARVHARDLQLDDAGWSLVVHGKGGRERLVPLTDLVAAELRRRHGWAFPSRQGGHLTPVTVGRMVARILPDGWTMHTLRHRAATRYYALDRDLVTIRDLLGHQSLDTTRRYIQTPDDARRRLVERAAYDSAA